jgi:hypothetical protein
MVPLRASVVRCRVWLNFLALLGGWDFDPHGIVLPAQGSGTWGNARSARSTPGCKNDPMGFENKTASRQNN